MAFDIYAGGFARFYAREWENVVQAHARETGMHYQMIYPGDDPGPADWDEVAEAVQRWRQAIIAGLGEHAPVNLDWSEDRSGPYFTDRPGWEGYSGLVVMAACTALGEPLPDRLDEDALVSEVVQRTYDPELRGAFRSITRTQLWLPGTFEFSFDFVNLCDEQIHIASLQLLNKNLAELKERQQIDEGEAEAVLREGCGEDADVRTMGVFGYAVFAKVARQALENRLPMILSF